MRIKVLPILRNVLFNLQNSFSFSEFFFIFFNVINPDRFKNKHDFSPTRYLESILKCILLKLTKFDCEGANLLLESFDWIIIYNLINSLKSRLGSQRWTQMIIEIIRVHPRVHIPLEQRPRASFSTKSHFCFPFVFRPFNK